MSVTDQDIDAWHNKIVKFRGAPTLYHVTAALREDDRIVLALLGEGYSKENPDWTTFRLTDDEFVLLTKNLDVVGEVQGLTMADLERLQ